MYRELNQLLDIFASVFFLFFLYILPFVVIMKKVKSYKKSVREKKFVFISQDRKSIKKFIFISFFLVLFFVLVDSKSCGELGCGLLVGFVILALVINLLIEHVGNIVAQSIYKKKYDQNSQTKNSVRK